MKLTLDVMPWSLAICRLATGSVIPEWVHSSGFWNVTANNDELSIVCEEHLVPPQVKFDSGWAALKIQGPLDFELTGILSQVIAPLGEASISIFAISTFETDYILLKSHALAEAKNILSKFHNVIGT